MTYQEQVLVGFVGTGYVVLLVLLMNYLIAYDPMPRHVHVGWSRYFIEPSFKSNPIDAKFLGWARGMIRRLIRLAPNSWLAYTINVDFSTAMRKSILNLCDVQMVTGLAILISGFMVMDCGLSSYHWQIMVYLAWFSTVAHMSSLTSVRDYLSTRPWQRNIRFLLTLILLAMLITAIVPTAYFRWSSMGITSDDRKGTLTRSELQALPAACFLRSTAATFLWDSQYCPADGSSSNIYPSPCTFETSFLGDNGPYQSAVFSITLLIFTFVTRTIKLFNPLSALASRFLTRPVSRLLHRTLLWLSRSQRRDPDLSQAAWPTLLRQKLLFRLVTRPVLALLLMLRLQVDLFSSMLSELFWLMCILAWGTVKLLSSRNTLDTQILEEETQWTYGQILPVLLLVMPVLGVAGTLSVETKPKLAAAAAAVVVVPSQPPATTRDSTSSGRGVRLLRRQLSVDSLEMTDMTGDHVSVSAAEGNPGSSTTAPDLKRLLSRDSLDMTDGHDDPAAHGAPDWLVRNYYDSFWANYCIGGECAVIFAYGIILFSVVFNFGDGMGLASQFNLLQFWFSEFAGVYSLVTVPLACFATFLVGLGMDKWLQAPGSRPGKHVVMLLLVAVIHTGYVFMVLLGPFLPWGTSGSDVHVLRVAAIISIAVGLYCLYALVVVVGTFAYS
ncbi:hypothetical protein F5144DRAFT_208057 [Chaetomium tenue]|uniref:Uncharacterized protein n=1 Tax=Chaetomium tenue TaxID=1854479 RepID=A0ACB7PFW3_9PEZI|nr:hypothetical protein F5144DRAFT_208057 [Chaetomium globosum]